MGDFHIPFYWRSGGAPAKWQTPQYRRIPKGERCYNIMDNPFQNLWQGGTLESLQKVEIYRSNELLATIDNPTIGGVNHGMI